MLILPLMNNYKFGQFHVKYQSGSEPEKLQTDELQS